MSLFFLLITTAFAHFSQNSSLYFTNTVEKHICMWYTLLYYTILKGGAYSLRRILVCAADADKAKQIYLRSLEILKSMKFKGEIAYTNSAETFSEGVNLRNKPYDIFILDAEDPACITLADNLRKKNLIVSIIFFNIGINPELKNITRYRPSYTTLLCEDNSDLDEALRWCCIEQLRAHPFFTVKNKDVQMRIDHQNILYFESRQRIVVMHTTKQAIEFYAKLSQVHSTLPPDNFIRCHQSYIVNMNRVKSLDKANRLFVLDSGATIEISKSQYPTVLTEYDKFTSYNC